MGSVRGLSSSLILASVSACSTTATVTRSDGYSLEGRIPGGTPNGIIVDPRIGERQEIPRSRVVDIDHPGNVHVLVGGIVLGLGGLSAGASCSNLNAGSDRESGCLYATTMAITGAAILGWGLYHWLGSKDAAGDVSMEPVPHRERWGAPCESSPPKTPRSREPEPDREPPPHPDELPPPGAAAPPGAPPALPPLKPPAPAPSPPSSSSPAPAPPPPEPPGGVDW